jgi:hypothetical protein
MKPGLPDGVFPYQYVIPIWVYFGWPWNGLNSGLEICKDFLVCLPTPSRLLLSRESWLAQYRKGYFYFRSTKQTYLYKLKLTAISDTRISCLVWKLWRDKWQHRLRSDHWAGSLVAIAATRTTWSRYCKT